MRFINWLCVFISILTLAFVCIGSYRHFATKILDNKKVIDVQSTQNFTDVFTVDSGNNVAAGSVAEFKVSFSDPLYDKSELVTDLYYSQDKLSDQKAKEDFVNGDSIYKIKTDLYEEQIYYYFVLNYKNQKMRYPAQGYLTKQLEEAREFQVSNVKHNPLSYADVKSNNKVDLAISLDDRSSIGDVMVYFSINDLPYQSDIVQFSNNYQIALYLPSNLEKLEYYFEFETASEKFKYPQGSAIILFDADKQAVEKELISYAKTHHFDLNLEFDDLKGNTIDIDSDQRVSGLSTIKFYIMLEVYKQLSEGKLSMTDHVSRYGYSGTVEQALRSMMISSVNEAAGALILKVGGTESINSTIKKYLGDNTKSVINHTPGYLEHGYNYVTPQDQVKLLSMIYNKSILSDQADAMISLMTECKDYFGVKSISGIEEIVMKTGYAPSNSYGLIGIVNQTSKNPYTFAMHIQAQEGNYVRISDIKNLLSILQGYSTQLSETN